MKKTFEYLRKYINQKGLIYKIKFSPTLNKLEKDYDKLTFFIEDTYDCQIDTEYIIFENTGDKLSLTWNITELNKALQQNNKNTAINITVSEIKKVLGEEEFFKCISNIYNEPIIKNKSFSFSNEPIDIMKLAPTEQYYILDGKHRVYNAYHNGQDIEAYILNSDLLVPFLAGNHQKCIYFFICKLFRFLKRINLF